MNSFARTALAVAVAGCLGGYIYFVESKRDSAASDVGSGTGAAGKKEKVFPGLDRAKVRTITLERRGEPSVVMGKDGEAWNLRAPKVAPGDATEISSLLDSLSSLETEEIVSENEANLAPFGLDSPRVVVRVEVEGGDATKPLAFAMGDSVPAGSGVFGRVPDSSRVFTIASYLEGTFNKTAFDFRDRALVRVKREAMRRVEVTGKNAFVLARSGDAGPEAAAEWFIEKPLKTRAARWTVDSFLGLIENLKMDALEVEEASPRDFSRTGFTPPQVAIRIALADGGKTNLAIGKKTDDSKYFARAEGSNLIARIGTALIDDIEKGVKNVRMTRLLDIATYEVTGFDVAVADTTRSFTKATTKDDKGVESTVWKGAALAKDVASDKVSDALFAVGGLEAAEFEDTPKPLAAYGLDKPALRVKIRFEAGKPEDWFEVATSGDAAYGRRRDDTAVLKLDKKKTEELIASFIALGS